MSTGLKANSDGSAAIQVGGTDVITLTSGGAATFLTSPTTVQAGTAAAPSITFSGDTNTGIYSPGADQVAIATGGTKRFEVDAAGNAGLRVTPSAWGSTYPIIQIGQTAGFGGNTTANRAYVFSNVYYDGSNYRYITTSPASWHEQSEGAHYLFSAGSGTAGNTISATQVMQVDVGKSLALQGATSQTGTGITFPATQSASSNANTLDDYEEGSFTPTLTYETPGTLSVGYADRSGRYTKVGKVVYVEIIVRLNAFTKGTASGILLIGGLPFTCQNGDPSSFLNIGFYNSSFNQFPVALVVQNNTTVLLLAAANNTVWASQPDADSNAQYFLSGWYTTNT